MGRITDRLFWTEAGQTEIDARFGRAEPGRAPTRATAQGAAVSQRSKTRWPWIILGVFLLAAKAESYTVLVHGIAHHPRNLYYLLPVLAFAYLLAGKPVKMALMLAPLIALVIAPGSALVGVGIAFGAFLMLVVACIAIGTLLTLASHSSGT